MKIKINTYGTIRKRVLKKWLKKTKRVRLKFEDDFSKSLDCVWQNKAEKLGYDHISVFCSLGEWSTNLTDLLTEEKYDDLKFDKDFEIVFRIYTRYFLIISEILEDFININKEIKKLESKKKSGNDLENNSFRENELKNLSDYINTIFKHKYENLHLHNHHIKKCFLDITDSKSNWEFECVDIITIDKVQQTYSESGCIEIPRLNYLIEVILKCYDKIKKEFKANDEYFNRLCVKFDRKSKTAANN